MHVKRANIVRFIDKITKYGKDLLLKIYEMW